MLFTQSSYNRTWGTRSSLFQWVRVCSSFHVSSINFHNVITLYAIVRSFICCIRLFWGFVGRIIFESWWICGIYRRYIKFWEIWVLEVTDTFSVRTKMINVSFVTKFMLDHELKNITYLINLDRKGTKKVYIKGIGSLNVNLKLTRLGQQYVYF